MADGQPAPARPVVVVAMKGYPGSGKSTAAHAIAAALRCPLLDKDDVRDCTLPLEGLVATRMLNDLSYAVLWRMVEHQVRLGLSIVIDSPLSHRDHLDTLTCLAGALVVIVECRPGDNAEWRQRLESRGAASPMVVAVMDGINRRRGPSWRGFWKGTKVAQTMKLRMCRGLWWIQLIRRLMRRQ